MSEIKHLNDSHLNQKIDIRFLNHFIPINAVS